MTNEIDENQYGLHFPCEFVIKVFGIASSDFEINVLAIIRNYIHDLQENCIRSRTSKDGKYLSLTITLPVDSREQLDSIYRELSSSSHVLMVL